MYWWNVIILGAIPILSVAIIFCMKRKLLWTAPIISSTLAFLCYMIELAPITLEKLFSNNEWRAFYILAMLMHVAIVVVLTAFAYLGAYMIKRKQK